MFSRAELMRLRDGLAALMRQGGAPLTDFYSCPHAPAASKLGSGCLCRKPAPGLLRQAARRHALDLSRSWMVGDILDDVEAGAPRRLPHRAARRRQRDRVAAVAAAHAAASRRRPAAGGAGDRRQRCADRRAPRQRCRCARATGVAAAADAARRAAWPLAPHRRAGLAARGVALARAREGRSLASGAGVNPIPDFADTHRRWRDARNILLVRLDNLGDVLMTTPAIAGDPPRQPRRPADAAGLEGRCRGAAPCADARRGAGLRRAVEQGPAGHAQPATPTRG